jgi:hypothetical protein
MEKPILPRKVCVAIENLRARGISNKKLLNYPSIHAHNGDVNYKTISEYIKDENNLEIYAKAIIIGYISDKSPKEKLRDFYEFHKERNLHVGASVIEKVCEILEIKVKGINC